LKNIFITLLLFSCSGSTEDLQGPLQTGWKGQKVCKKLSENTHDNILLCTFPPNSGHEKHKHNANFGYAISGGTVLITDDKGTRTVILQTDSHFNSKGTPWHSIQNIGQTTIKYLIVESKQ
jgi:hypothetical protein